MAPILSLTERHGGDPDPMKRTSIQTQFGSAGAFSNDVCAQPGAYAFVVSVHRPRVGDPKRDEFAP